MGILPSMPTWFLLDLAHGVTCWNWIHFTWVLIVMWHLVVKGTPCLSETCLTLSTRSPPFFSPNFFWRTRLRQTKIEEGTFPRRCCTNTSTAFKGALSNITLMNCASIWHNAWLYISFRVKYLPKVSSQWRQSRQTRRYAVDSVSNVSWWITLHYQEPLAWQLNPCGMFHVRVRFVQYCFLWKGSHFLPVQKD